MRTSLTGLYAPPTPCPPVHFPHLIQNDPPNLNRSCLSLAYPWRILFVMWMQVKFAMAYMALQTLSCLLPPVASHSVVHALCSSVHSWILATKSLQVFSAADPFVKFFTCLVPLFFMPTLEYIHHFFQIRSCLLIELITVSLVFPSLLLSSCGYFICIFIVSLPYKYKFHGSGDCGWFSFEAQ